MRHRKLLINLAAMYLLVLVALSVVGCKSYTVHPGAVSTFDSQAYDVLLVTHNVIETTKNDLINNAFTPTVAAKVKIALNDLIKAYNVADPVYQAYHTAAVNGKATVAQANAVQATLNQVTSMNTALSQAKVAQ